MLIVELRENTNSSTDKTWNKLSFAISTRLTQTLRLI